MTTSLTKLTRIITRDGVWYTTKRAMAYAIAHLPFNHHLSFSYYQGTKLTFTPAMLTYKMFANRQSRKNDVEIFAHYLTPDGVAIDVGANIGSLTIPAAYHAGKDGTVLAFEPSPKFANIIQQNVVRNQFEDRVIVHQIALGATEGTVHLNESVADDTTNHVSTSGTAVPQAPLDSFTTDIPKIDLLKIDVEGYEIEVLKGATETLGKTAALYIECNSRALERAGESASSLVALLRPHFTLYNKADMTPFQLDPARQYNTDLVGHSQLYANQA